MKNDYEYAVKLRDKILADLSELEEWGKQYGSSPCELVSELLQKWWAVSVQVAVLKKELEDENNQEEPKPEE